MSRSSFRTIEGYLLREFFISFSIAFLFFFFIFFVNQLLLLARNILISTVSLTDVALIILYSVPIILSFTFPFAALSGTAMALGTLSAGREIMALRSSGISFRLMLRPFILAAIVLSVVSFITNDMFLPLGTIEYRRLYRELLYKTPELEIRPYSPSIIQDTMIISRSSGEEQIEDVIIIDTSSPIEKRSVIFAESGRFTQDLEGTTVFRFLEAAGTQGRDGESFERFEAEMMDLFFSMDQATFSMLSLSPAEMSFLDVYHEIAERREDIAQTKQRDRQRMEELEALIARDLPPEERRVLLREYDSLAEKSYVSRTLRFYEIELFRKIALPLGCLFLIFIALPIAVIPIQHGKIIGFGIGVLMSTLYWIMMFSGQSYGVRTELPPALLMLGPNVLFALIGAAAFAVLKRR